MHGTINYMVNVIEHQGKAYPRFQSEGNAAQFAIPFALHLCKGKGVDIGCNNLEWKFPGALPVDPAINEYDAMNFPYDNLDYIFSSHCLEHIPDWVGVLDYWHTKIKIHGVIFLYLPHYSQTYWRPWHNRKHVNILEPHYLHDYFTDKKYQHVWTSGPDLNNAFYAVAVK